MAALNEQPISPRDNYDELPETSRPPMVDRQMSVATTERMRFVEGEFKVSFTAFCRAVMCSDPVELYAWRQKQRVLPSKEDKFDAFFIAEHFKMFSRQAGRDLDKHDLDTIIWLKKLYDGKISAKDQPLPYRKEPANFWRHLLDCEKTVRGVAAVWCMQDPKVVFGFLSRPDAVEVLRNANGHHRTGTFFFRLSNSEPTKLVLVYARKRTREREVAPGVVKAVANHICTRMETESCPAVQCSVKCKDCDVSCCISCAKICHDKHELSAVSTMKEFCCACKGCKIMKSCEELQKHACWVAKCKQLAGAQGFCESHSDRACEATPVQGEYVVEQTLIDCFSSLAQFSEFLLSHPDLKTVLPDGKKCELTREELLGKFDDPYLAVVFKQYSDFSLVYNIEGPPEGAPAAKPSSQKREADPFEVCKPPPLPASIPEDDDEPAENATGPDNSYDSVPELGVGPSHYL